MLQALRSSKILFSQEPHGVTSQKTAFFIVTEVKTSNLTFQEMFLTFFNLFILPLQFQSLILVFYPLIFLSFIHSFILPSFYFFSLSFYPISFFHICIAFNLPSSDLFSFIISFSHCVLSFHRFPFPFHSSLSFIHYSLFAVDNLSDLKIYALALGSARTRAHTHTETRALIF
jgi:hypothetical protein